MVYARRWIGINVSHSRRLESKLLCHEHVFETQPDFDPN